MNSKERVLKAISHEEPDRVPLDEDLARPEIWRQLLSHFGTQDPEKVRRHLGIDFRTIAVDPGPFIPGHPAGFLQSHGQFPDPFPPGTVFEDMWGIKQQVSPDGKFARFVHHPLERIESPDELDQFEFPSVDKLDFADAEKSVKTWQDQYAIAANMQMTIFEIAWYLRGFNRLLRDFFDNQRLVDALFDRILKYRIELGRRYLDLGVDIIRLGDDLGTQKSLIISLTLWRRFIKERMHRLCQELRKGGAHLFYHCDGIVEPFIPDLIHVGVGILDPVQPECNDVYRIKNVYGAQLTLHGTLPFQTIIPYGTVEDVRREVVERLEKLGPGGGLVLSSSPVLPDVSLEKVLEVYQLAKKKGTYPIRIRGRAEVDV